MPIADGTQTNRIGYAFLWLPSKIFSSDSIESAMKPESKLEWNWVSGGNSTRNCERETREMRETGRETGREALGKHASELRRAAERCKCANARSSLNNEIV